MPSSTLRNLLQLASILPKQGIGTKFVKKTWTDPGFFWTLDRVAYGKTAASGKAWGRLTWRGEDDGKGLRRIPGDKKTDWKFVTGDSQEPSA